MVENLRATGNYTAKYRDEEERRVLQRAGRIARETVKPRRMSFRSVGGAFAAWWTDPTPLEDEITTLRAMDAIDAALRDQSPGE
ncbi:hypothetical protein [Actinomadura chibensis]|uniref:Uncharacterized protein n=1 Tax=Actinomadura chibensis TaxID=392828 RepID=A0A5D0NZ28_9ACTN|nr:hypothetical protein [Actinomadura chibensis]TYB49725.1 hypothetical protein FXF69_11865 [Actinomadura chibensis]